MVATLSVVCTYCLFRTITLASNERHLAVDLCVGEGDGGHSLNSPCFEISPPKLEYSK